MIEDRWERLKNKHKYIEEQAPWTCRNVQYNRKIYTYSSTIGGTEYLQHKNCLKQRDEPTPQWEFQRVGCVRRMVLLKNLQIETRNWGVKIDETQKDHVNRITPLMYNVFMYNLSRTEVKEELSREEHVQTYLPANHVNVLREPQSPRQSHQYAWQKLETKQPIRAFPLCRSNTDLIVMLTGNFMEPR